ncbi:ADAMTS-like protein 4 isoform X2 [Rhinatrema bivittatum]|uniref:ADAMTS-like protein 4 isoform X2 n=1 Tax=Rhinatrema bivittatum TaxID=194408 RepID=UPI00112648D4|nr:ADAMTS-like protein 4 isoform X2 [Rhinatrema bivittatum]
MAPGHGRVGRLGWMAFALSLLVLIAPQCHAHRKLSLRKSRQASEDEGTGNKIPGDWGTWGSWSSCSQPCGVGVMERSRTCQPPHQRALGGLRSESSPPGVRAQSQPRLQGERASLYEHAGRWPSYPLHTSGDAALPPAGPLVPLHGSPRQAPPHQYGPFHRHTRHESFAAEDLPATHNRGPLSNRRPALAHGPEAALDQEVGWLQKSRGLSSGEVVRPETSSDYRSSPFHRASSRRNTSGQDSSAFHSPFFRASVPLFKPEHPDGQQAESPDRGALTDLERGNGHRQSDLPRQELHSSRRSWVRDAIKPGRYGYGKLPFALPLHKAGSDGGQRFKRHHNVRSADPKSPPKNQKQRVVLLIGSLAERTPGAHVQEEPPRGAELTDKLLDAKSRQQFQGRPQTKRPDQAHCLSCRKDLPNEQQDRMQDGSESVDAGHRESRKGDMDRRKQGRATSTVRDGDSAEELGLEELSDDFLGSKGRYGSQSSSEEDRRVFLLANVRHMEETSESEELEGDVLSRWDKYQAQKNDSVHVREVISDSPAAPQPTEKLEKILHLSQTGEKWKSSLQTITGIWEIKTTTSSELQIDNRSERAERLDDPRESLRSPKDNVSVDLKPSEKRKNICLDLPRAEKENKIKTRRSAEPRESRAVTSQPMEEEVRSTEIPRAKSGASAQNLSLSGPGLNVLNKQSSSLDQQQNQNQQVGALVKQRRTQLPKQHEIQSNGQGSQQQQTTRSSPNVFRSASRTSGEVQPEEEKMTKHQHPHSPHRYSWPHAQLGSLTPAGQGARPRSQRQHSPSQGGHRSRAPQSPFRELPSTHRQEEPDTWLLYSGNPIRARGRGRGQRPDLHASAEMPQWNLYHPGTESFYCEGEQRQYKACSQESCPAGTPDPRALQCATLNRQEFMGRLYQWEPFTEVRGAQKCELNCRPIGYRFYVRHTEKVQDGTPCEASSADICVAGHCLRPGCDGILGSNMTLDGCGMCGGDSSTCRLVAGTFNDSNVPIGYHKILEIPRGATKINVTENTRSPNYLALRRRSGKSVINGNWAVDPPGRYEAGGTIFTYTRPGREDTSGAESFTAQGPTTEPLDVYMIFQQDNPGISYSFYLASFNRPENPIPALVNPRREPDPMTSAGDAMGRQNARPRPPGRQSPRAPGVLQRNIRIPPLPVPPVQHWPELPEFYWRQVGNTECTVTCGKGSWLPVFRCVSRRFQEEVEEKECDAASRPVPTEEACNTQSCPAYWDAGEWSACSRSCGAGVQHRPITCRQMYANRTTMVLPQRCAHLEKPNATQPCHLQICSHWETSANWSMCSVPCGQGQRTRHVRCVSNHGDTVSDRECNGRLRPRASEACDMGPCVRTWFHNDWSNTCSAECGMGIQRRSVVCLSSHAGDALGESCPGARPLDMRACDSGPCLRAVRWYTGPWSQCSAECDGGTQRRDVICVSRLGSEFNVTDPSRCAHLEKPVTLQPCAASPCRARWFTTPWSTMRTVRTETAAAPWCCRPDCACTLTTRECAARPAPRPWSEAGPRRLDSGLAAGEGEAPTITFTVYRFLFFFFFIGEGGGGGGKYLLKT